MICEAMGMVLDARIRPVLEKFVLTILADGSGEGGLIGTIKISHLEALTSASKSAVLAALAALAASGFLVTADPANGAAPAEGDLSWVINLHALRHLALDEQHDDG